MASAQQYLATRPEFNDLSKSYPFPSLLRDGQIDRECCKIVLDEHDRRKWLRKQGKVKFIDFDDAERKKLKKYFEEIDDDGSGCIGTDELEEILTSLGLAERTEDVVRLMKTVDKDGSGLLEFNEFCSIIRSDGSDGDPNSPATAIFQVFKSLMEGKMGDEQLAFPLVISCYRRKMLLDAMMTSGTRQGRGQRILRILKHAHDAQAQRLSEEGAKNKEEQKKQAMIAKMASKGNENKARKQMLKRIRETPGSSNQTPGRTPGLSAGVQSDLFQGEIEVAA